MMYSWIILLVIAIVAGWYLINNKNTSTWAPKEESPMDILKRRFANGEITEEEYEERKAVLEEDEYLKHKP